MVVPVVLPALIVNPVGVGTLAVLVLVQLKTKPPVGAACDNVNVSVADKPSPTEVDPLMATEITVTDAVAFIKPVWLAVIVDEPAATPVMLKVAVVALAANVTVAGTVTLLGLLELRLIVKPPVGASPPTSVIVRGCTSPTPI